MKKLKQILSTILCAGIISLAVPVTGIGSLKAKAASAAEGVFINLPSVSLDVGQPLPPVGFSDIASGTESDNLIIFESAEWRFAADDSKADGYVQYNQEYYLQITLIPGRNDSFLGSAQPVFIMNASGVQGGMKSFPSEYKTSTSTELILEFRYNEQGKYNDNPPSLSKEYSSFKTQKPTVEGIDPESIGSVTERIDVNYNDDVDQNIRAVLERENTVNILTDENQVRTTASGYDKFFKERTVEGTIEWDYANLSHNGGTVSIEKIYDDLNGGDYVITGTVKEDSIQYTREAYEASGASGGVADETLKMRPGTVLTVKRTIRVGKAGQVLTPTAEQASGTYDVTRYGGYLAVNLQTATKDANIHYVVSTDKNKIEKIKNISDTTWLDYDGAITEDLYTGFGERTVYYLKAYAEKEGMFPSAVSEMYTYTLERDPDGFKNISAVHIVVSPLPKGGDSLADTIATCNDFGIKNCTFQWDTSSKTSAKYGTKYTAKIHVIPEKNFYFLGDGLVVTVNGKEVSYTRSYDEQNITEIIVTYEYTTPKDVVTAFSPMSMDISFPASTTLSAIINAVKSQFSSVEVTSEGGSVTSFPVTWSDFSALSTYNPFGTEGFNATVYGKIMVDDTVDTSRLSKTVTANISVSAANQAVKPYVTDVGFGNENTFDQNITVHLTSYDIEVGTPGAAIHYTVTDVTKGGTASDPTVVSTTYRNGIQLKGIPGRPVTYEIRAIVIADGKKASEVLKLKYTIELAPEQIGPVSSTLKENTESDPYTEIQYTELYCESEPDAKIYYTITIGSGNESSPILYDGLRIAVSGAQGAKVPVVIRAYAQKENMADSEIKTFVYWVDRSTEPVAEPTVDVTPGTYKTPLSVRLSCETPGAVIRYTLDGSDPRTNGLVFDYTNERKFIDIDAPVGVKTTIKLRAIATKNGMDDSRIVEFTYVIDIPTPGPAVTRIEIVTRPLKYTYTKGTSLNVAGGRIKVTYSDGKEEIIDMTEDMVYGFDSWQTGVQTLIVEYGGKRDAFNIRVQGSGTSGGSTSSGSGGGTTTKPDDKTEEPPEIDDTSDSNLGDNIPRISGTTAAGWAKIIARLAEFEKGSRVIITLNGATSVPAEVLNAAAARSLILEIRVNGSISWTVDTGLMSSAAANMSAGVSTNSIYLPQVLVDGAGEKELIRFHVGENKLGALLNFRGAEKGKFANLFKYNSKTQELEFVDVAKVGSNGIATITPSTVGDYVIILDAETKMLGDIDNSTKLNALDAAYLLKLLVNSSEISAKGDINRDGRINALDAYYILKKCVGTI